ncbi:hypothetical protein GCM10011360_10940 [Primorskyibacter flagellatus]|uniref:HupE / UreJ protein n=2 Tax=Primorskyibacter flagellatus TaxID=1387277 RepID=A0A917A479_9RHOB|nr:hypothetical protein GCM10011360_10940 [Primorskyibacter flagellatus]
MALPATAHEVLPTVGLMSRNGDTLRLELRLNAEALVAGIDLDGLMDTNTSDRSAEYDTLRLLEPDALAARITQDWPRISDGLAIGTDTGDIPLSIEAVEVTEVGDPELARASRVILEGALPAGADTVSFAWPEGHGTLALRVTGVENGFADYVEGGERIAAIALTGGDAQSGWQAFASYIPVGFDHILPKGLDHILFVLGLFFLSPAVRPLLWQVSAFTLAHTVTLALGALGWVNVPGSIVEPLIAASIAFIAIENIFSTNLHRWRPVVVFAFGLLHGLGFASVLQDFGLPQDQLIPALLGFNLGVEFGQLTVIALAFLAVGAWFRHKSWYRAAISIPASVLIACVGLYWAVERTFL